jgi:hypothetical protein
MNQLLNPTKTGLPQSGERQDIYMIMSDIIYYAPTVALTEQEFFTHNGGTKNAQYRSGIFTDVANQKNLVIKGFRCTHNIALAARSSEPAATTQWYFENFSRIKVEVLEKAWDSIPLSFLLATDMYWATTAMAFAARNNPFFYLKEPIIVPVGGNIKFTFAPAAGLTTITTTTTSPQLPNLGLTSDYGYSLKLDIFGRQDRVVS